jgi:5'-3' exonuclease
LEQKEAINLAKLADFEAKLQQRSETFAKDLEEARAKHNLEREGMQRECEELRERTCALEDEKSALSWTMQKDVALLQ